MSQFLVLNEVLNLAAYIDSGSGKNPKILALASCDLSSLEMATFLGLHSYSGNDYRTREKYTKVLVYICRAWFVS